MAKGKTKRLRLIRIFTENTDDEHALTLQDTIAKPSSESAISSIGLKEVFLLCVASER